MPGPVAVINDKREDGRRVPGLWMLLSVLLAFGCDVAQELEHGPVLGPALVLEQQVDVQGLAAVGDPVDQVRIGRAQVACDVAVLADLQRRYDETIASSCGMAPRHVR